MTRDMLALAAHRTAARDDVRRLEAILLDTRPRAGRMPEPTKEHHMTENALDPLAAAGLNADDIRAADDAAGQPPALDIDPGPTLDVAVIPLEDYSENVAGFLVTGTTDEALARRLLAKSLTDEYGASEAEFYIDRLAKIHPGDTYAGPFVEATELRYESGDYDRADHSQYLRGDSLVTAFAGTTVEVSAVVQGVRFLIDVERD